ncbi:DUF1592 domain-containing protein [Candidatus Poribacteria bacterium]|nr:DUF1592 domain-containing protein [Candidatus Poribacteria bacterium]
MRLAIRILLVCAAAVAVGCSSAAVKPNFAEAGQPLVAKYCVSCHGGRMPAAGLALDKSHDGEPEAASIARWEKVAKMVRGRIMPPEGSPKPSPDEVAAFIGRMDAAFAHADRQAKPDPGRVTMRRLNRVEYRNTIRDLIGVDFDPTETFPSDDIGYGFDNIGDVLTLSPALMERYLAAAESIAFRAITPEPPPVPKRRINALHAEPASNEIDSVLEDGWRRVASDGTKPIETGPLNAQVPFEDVGEYIFRARLYAKSAPPVRVAVLVQGQNLPSSSSDEELSALVGDVSRPALILGTFEVRASNRDAAEMLELPLAPMPGRDRIFLALAKPSSEEPPAQVVVDYVALEGPLDTRPESHKTLLACSPDKPQGEQIREVLSRFLRRAYRRPPTAEELERAASAVDGVVADGRKWEAGIQLVVQATLCSPKFLFRVELDDRTASPGPQALDEFPLASRLSYFLWSSMPDDELLDLAERNQLSANLEAQTRRMLADPKSKAFVENFALQWLQVRRIQTIAPDASLFPSFNDRLREAMLQETALFFESILREDRSVLDLIDADYTFLNEPLARHYGIADTKGTWVGQEPVEPGGEPIKGPEFRRVSLQGRQRGGLLTQASVLAVTSNPTRTSPVKRGRWALEQILGAPPPPPPPDVPELAEDQQAVTSGSLRERMEIHRRNPACANCHKDMDAIGFAFENYDAIGAYREKDGAFEIDPSGVLVDGTAFQGAEELKQVILGRRDLFARCLAEKMLTYALGRGPERSDRPYIDGIVSRLAEQDYRFSALVTAIVASDPFRKRRGAETVVAD